MNKTVAASEAGAPITLHLLTGRVLSPLGGAADQTPVERQENPALWIALFNEIQTVLANDFIFGGILERFPKLREKWRVQLLEAAHRALDGDFHQYAITWGAPRLRRSIADKYKRCYAMAVSRFTPIATGQLSSQKPQKMHFTRSMS